MDRLLQRPTKPLIIPLLLGLLLSGCANQLFYHPDKEDYRSPSQDGYTFEESYFESEDGTKLHTWRIPAIGEEKGSVLHFHGNAQNLSAHYAFVSWLPKNGYTLYLFDYRGYGKSEGVTSRKGLHQDSVAALRYFEKQTEGKTSPRFVIAQSLGAANAIVAIAQTSDLKIDGIVSDSAFSSYQAIASEKLGKSPLKLSLPLLVSSGFDPIDWVDKLDGTPIAFVHGTADKVVSDKHVDLLYAKAKHPKLLWIIEGGQHTNALTTNREIFIPRILRFFDQCTSNDFPENEPEPSPASES